MAEVLQSAEFGSGLSAASPEAGSSTIALASGRTVEAWLRAGVFGDSELVVVVLRCTGPTRRPRLKLSVRERQIAELVALGLRDKEIAKRLRISITTVRTHLRRVRERHRFSVRGELAHHLLAGLSGRRRRRVGRAP